MVQKEGCKTLEILGAQPKGVAKVWLTDIQRSSNSRSMFYLLQQDTGKKDSHDTTEMEYIQETQ